MAQLQIRHGQAEDFEAAFAEAQSIVAGMKGYRSHQLQKCLEIENRYLLLVEWDSLEDHTEGFRGSADYKRWRELLHNFYDPFPEVLHYQAVDLKRQV